MEETVVLYPSLGTGHMTPIVALANRFLHAGFSATILVVPSPFPVASVDSLVARVSATNPSILFHRLPPLSQPPKSHPNPLVVIFELLQLYNTHILSHLQSIAQTTTIRALVLDLFCAAALDVATELGIPSYFFSSTSAASLALFLRLPTLKTQPGDKSLEDLGEAPVQFPGLPSIPAYDMPRFMTGRDEAYDALLEHCARYPLASGILVNSFEYLEPRAIRAISNGLCAPGRPTPPLYSVGPLTTDTYGSGEREERHECLKWLDARPHESVVFLCFGSMGSFSAEQTRNIATGLEKSGRRFLWVVKSPTRADPEKRYDGAKPELPAILPEGFLERTSDRGMVVKSWAPQVAVLGHGAVGGFVTHCGWNSVLEAVCSGVPMVAWPLFAEQSLNKVLLVEEIGLAVEIRRSEEGLVEADEVEEKVSWLMASEGGREMRARAVKAREAAAAALKEGGPSEMAIMELVKEWKRAESNHWS